ncbi:MAG: ribosome-associated translation inhibitor RaiA [Candidatus Aminicenantes bacterium]|nr:ribosome-associated translation inhibitor RaiA [Candidatus Aminicenantes bacterium]
MNLQITSRHAALVPQLRAFSEARLKEMAKLLAFATDVDVIAAKQRDNFKIEIHVLGKGGGLLVTEESRDLESSVRRAFEALEKKLKKEREKLREKKRRGGRERKILASPVEPVSPPEAERRVIRADYFAVKPMSVEDALMAFEAKKREVLMFRSDDGGRWAVLYRRKDGHVGLVAPE